MAYTPATTPLQPAWNELPWRHRLHLRWNMYTHFLRRTKHGDGSMFTIYMGPWFDDPAHVIGYSVTYKEPKATNGFPVRNMANNWRCAIVRWVIRRLLV